jgi:succinate-semialdehyde dehydrogenase / glutarate-semialdehyde dehydrogenase
MPHVIQRLLAQPGSYVAGRWRSCDSTQPLLNPATGAELAQVPTSAAHWLEEALVAAVAAQRLWRCEPPAMRADRLRRLAAALREHSQALAELVTQEQGKPCVESLAEVHYSADYFEWFAGEAERLYGRQVPAPTAEQAFLVLRQPLGVVACITPWNFPMAMLARKMAAALAAGNAVIAKPAYETPLSAMALMRLAEKVDFPPGLVNLVVGQDAQAIGARLCADSRIAKVSFTGSTATGRCLLAQSAQTLQRTAMELGGNAPFVVFADADLDKAVAGFYAAKFRNAGQACISANRLLLHRAIATEFLARLRALMQQRRLGNGLDPTVTQGPLINRRACERIASLVSAAQAAGAQVESFGHWATDTGFRQENFYRPQWVLGVRPEMRIFQEEIFGPVVSVCEFEHDDQAIALANQTPFGLAAYVYTESASRLWRLPGQLQVGMLGLNEHRLSHANAPFGGVKASGFGREGGAEGLDDYLAPQYLAWGF